MNTTDFKCQSSVPGCIEYSSTLGCSKCKTGMVLNRSLQCQKACVFPCASCQATSATSCTTCLMGYSLSGSTCVIDLSCNSSSNCKVCPQGYTLKQLLSGTNIIGYQCMQCLSSNCFHCNPSNLYQCLSCVHGYYLDGALCYKCLDKC